MTQHRTAYLPTVLEQSLSERHHNIVVEVLLFLFVCFAREKGTLFTFPLVSILLLVLPVLFTSPHHTAQQQH